MYDCPMIAHTFMMPYMWPRLQYKSRPLCSAVCTGAIMPTFSKISDLICNLFGALANTSCGIRRDRVRHCIRGSCNDLRHRGRGDVVRSKSTPGSRGYLITVRSTSTSITSDRTSSWQRSSICVRDLCRYRHQRTSQSCSAPDPQYMSVGALSGSTFAGRVAGTVVTPWLL